MSRRECFKSVEYMVKKGWWWWEGVFRSLD